RVAPRAPIVAPWLLSIAGGESTLRGCAGGRAAADPTSQYRKGRGRPKAGGSARVRERGPAAARARVARPARLRVRETLPQPVTPRTRRRPGEPSTRDARRPCPPPL